MIPSGTLARHSRELGALLAMGHPLLEALGRVRLRADDKMGPLLKALEEQVRGGASLSQALESQGAALPETFVRAVQVGEGAGDLPRALNQAAELLESAEWRRLGVQAALAYPRFLVTAGLAGCLVLAWLLPQLFNVFQGMSLNLPAPTRLVISLGRLLSTPLVLALVAILLAGFNAFLSGGGGLDSLRLRTPILGTWIRRQESVTCLEWLDYLLSLRLPLDEALRVSAGAASSTAFRQGVTRLAEEVSRGASLAEAPSAKVFPAVAVWLLGEAERREFPPGLLARVARTLQREADMSSRRGLALVEPVALVGVGLLVGLIVIAYFLPLYQLIGNLG